MIELKPLPFDEAIKFFVEKGLVISPSSWRDVWAEANVHAFTVARVSAMDVLEDIHREVDRASSAGITLDEFKASLEDTLARKGWLAPPGERPEEILPGGGVRKRLTGWRLETIFRTNVQSAYNAGRYKQMTENASRRPWWMYDAVEDSRTRPAHAAMDGRVYRSDDPVWDRWYPPNGFNCRCTVRTLSDRDMDRRGLKESVAPPKTDPDEGFDYNPGQEVKWEPDLSKYTPRAREILKTELEEGHGLE
jgi:SPP1 gp7 family putative phage head morphogenesis protein